MTEEFKKARDEHLEKMWLEIEPFGFDHPDTYDFIKDRMDWAYEWCQSEMGELDAEIIFLKNDKVQLRKIIDRLKEALEDFEKMSFGFDGAKYNECNAPVLIVDRERLESCQRKCDEALADVEKMEND